LWFLGRVDGDALIRDLVAIAGRRACWRAHGLVQDQIVTGEAWGPAKPCRPAVLGNGMSLFVSQLP
jgi:hypothetical protein